MAPVSGFVKSRGSLTIAASCGLASGTLMTSIRHLDGLSPVGGPEFSPSQPASSAGGRTVDVP